MSYDDNKPEPDHYPRTNDGVRGYIDGDLPPHEWLEEEWRDDLTIEERRRWARSDRPARMAAWRMRGGDDA